jgi:long-chain acyl-CoA synthetase
MGVGSTLLIAVLKAFTFVYDVITLPVYAIIQAPWTKKRDSKEAKVN